MKVYIGKYPKDESGRKVDVRIDKCDMWSLDRTLAYIIHPALVKFRENIVGYPAVEPEDVPGDFELNEQGYSKERWESALDAMIWSFEQILDDDYDKDFWDGDDLDAVIALEDKIHYGLTLFGKYYRYLWQ
jgi:hypothetical protein